MKRLGPTTVALAVVTSVFILPGSVSAAPTAARGLELVEITAGLSTPVDLRAPRGDDRLFIAELPGRIRIYENGQLRPTPFLDIQSRVSTGGERGLLAFDFHPDYLQNRLFYVYYTDNGGDTRVSEFRASSTNPNRASASSERILLEIDQPASNHNGGGLAFGPEGLLYIASGDGGGGGDPWENGQDTDTWLGSLLRIDVDRRSGNREYGIPAANPFKNGGGKKEIYAYGLRNPWRMSIDHRNSRIYIGDVGQSRREEIDTLRTDTTKAINFGWDVTEGTLCYEPASGCDRSGKREPILEYNNPDQGVSVIGGYVYRGNAIPWLRGSYFYSDLTGRRLKSFRYESGKVRKHTDWTSQVGLIPASVYAFGQDGFGELYVLSGSRVYKIEPAQPTVCDFDGDGDDDLAIGVSGENRNGVPDAGATQVFQTRKGEPGTAGDQLWDQDTPGVSGVAKGGDEWGVALACGDFDGDGYDDLAVGAPARDSSRGGSVSVLFGSDAGLSTRDQRLRQGHGGINGASEPGDDFGGSLAAGDFNGDGYDDLAVGVPGETLVGKKNAGKIHLIEGGASGLEARNDTVLHQDTPGIKQSADMGDRFGAALTAGDFDGDGYSDLAVGAPGETLSGEKSAGAVHVFYGRRGKGITVKGDDLLHQGRSGVKGDPGPSERFGASLAAGPVNADGYDELVVGIPGETIDGRMAAGATHYFKGSRRGLGTGGDRLLDQDTPGIAGKAQQGDRFGTSLALGDIDGDGFGDLVIGVPGEDRLGKSNSGAVNVVYGTADGPGTSGDLWDQDSPGVAGASQKGDRFGRAVALLDFEAHGRLDLVVGAPQEDVTGIADAGRVSIIFGNANGLFGEGLVFDQGTPGAKGTPGSGDSFGAWVSGS